MAGKYKDLLTLNSKQEEAKTPVIHGTNKLLRGENSVDKIFEDIKKQNDFEMPSTMRDKIANSVSARMIAEQKHNVRRNESEKLKTVSLLFEATQSNLSRKGE